MLSLILFLIISFQQLWLSTPKTSPNPHPPVSLCLSLKCMGLWWESIHGFNGFLWPFFQDLGDVFKKRKREKLACPGYVSKSVVDCRGQHFSLHQKNEKFSAYKTGRTSQYGSESWLTSIPSEKNTGRNVAVKLLPTYSEVKLGDRLESRKRGKSKMFNVWWFFFFFRTEKSFIFFIKVKLAFCL